MVIKVLATLATKFADLHIPIPVRAMAAYKFLNFNGFYVCFNALSNAFGPILLAKNNKLKTQENIFTTILTPLWVSSGGGIMFNVFIINAKIIPDTDIPTIVVLFFCFYLFYFIKFF